MPLDSNNRFEQWLHRCEGSWESHRRYLYGPKKTVDNLITKFDIEHRGGMDWAITWGSDRNTGEMVVTLDGSNLRRSRNYFEGEEGTVTRLEMIDEETVVFYSSYGGMDYREEIRFIYGDKYRLRQTVGCKEGTTEAAIVGQYMEYRVKN